DHDRASRSIPFSIGIGRSAEFSLQQDVNPLSRELFDALFYSPKLALTQTEALMSVVPERRTALQAMQARWGTGDAVGLVARPEPGVIAFLARPLSERRVLGRHDRRVLSQITLHLESACRLRRNPEAAIAVLTPDGKTLHREPSDL